MTSPTELDELSTRHTDLASRRLGGQTLACSNDFFAEMENLLKPGRGVFIDDKFTDRGKWMDGWESRRRRFLPDGSSDDGLEYDWCTIKLGAQGTIRGINVDTNHFTGNAPQKISFDACCIKGEPDENTPWQRIVDITPVNSHSENIIGSSSGELYTHVRLNMYPDGGVARLRVYGDITPDHDAFLSNEPIDLADIKNGARPLVCSDMFYSHMENLIMPGRGVNMGDGWETKRRRAIGDSAVDRDNDWLILQLATRGSVEKLLIDTCHFKGNYPHGFSMQGAILTDAQAADIELLKNDSHQDALTQGAQRESAINWQPIIERTKLYADREHLFKEELLVTEGQLVKNEQASTKPSFTHIRLKMYPDGGISRLRVWGYPTWNQVNE